MTETPKNLLAGGSALWAEIVGAHELEPQQLVQLEEACRAKDRCDSLDAAMRVAVDGPEWSSMLKDANATANLLKQLLAALRLPDPVTGKKPQFRGPRGAQAPSVPGGKVSSLERARAAKSG